VLLLLQRARDRCPDCRQNRLEAEALKRRVESMQSMLEHARELQKEFKTAAVQAVTHAQAHHNAVVGSVKRLNAGVATLAKLRDVMDPTVMCGVCFQTMRKVRGGLCGWSPSMLQCNPMSCWLLDAFGCWVQAVAFPGCGHSHCHDCLVDSSVRGGLRCPTCVRASRERWVRDNGEEAEQQEIAKARKRVVDALMHKEQPSSEAGNSKQLGRGSAGTQSTRDLVARTLRDMHSAAASSSDGNTNRTLPWVKSVRWRTLATLHPNPFVDAVVSKLDIWKTTLSHTITTQEVLASALGAVDSIRTADDLASAVACLRA